MRIRINDWAVPCGPPLPAQCRLREVAPPSEGVWPRVVVDRAGAVVGVLEAGAAAVSLLHGGVESAGELVVPAAVLAHGEDLEASRTDDPVVLLDSGRRPAAVVSRERVLQAALERVRGRLEKVGVALDAAHNAIVVVDAEGRIAACNLAFGRALGRDAADLRGRPVQEVVPHSEMLAVLRSGQAHLGRRITLGSQTYLSNRSPILEEGRVIGAVAVLQDVTALETARAERDEAERLRRVLQAVLDSAYEGILVVDEAARITMFNRAYGEFLGVDPASMVGRPVQEAIENTRMHLVLQTGEAERRQVQRIQGHDMVCDRIPIREGDQVVGAVGKVLFRDVSELDALAEEARRLKHEVEHYRRELRRQNGTRYSIASIVGDSQAMQSLRKLARRMARSASTVLLEGESGTGKELFAHAIHNLSPRADAPFVKLNCAALPENLIESELFGYRPGAFTGARRQGQVGKFELANGGTIFLDEVGELPLGTQVKLLRALQEREVEPLGSGASVPVDVRVIAATNRDLRQRVQQGLFRPDLLYRIHVIALEMPPLRDRVEDIPLLAKRLVAKLCSTLGVGPRRLNSATLELLCCHPWPGNVRELENALEWALNLGEGPEVLPQHLPLHVRRRAVEGVPLPSLRQVLDESEAELLRRALGVAGGRGVVAARLVGIGKSSFYEKAARHGLLQGRGGHAAGVPENRKSSGNLESARNPFAN